VIAVHQTPLQHTHTPDRACLWEARTTINGQTYTAQSRHGAVNELARVLVNAGISDGPMKVTTGNIQGHMMYRSLQEAARSDYTEGRATSLARVEWKDPATINAQFTRTSGDLQGGRVLPVAMQHPQHSKPEDARIFGRFERRT